MSSDDRVNPLTESSMTIPSDSEQYSGNDDISPSPPSSSSSPPMILYTPPTFWGLLRGAAINLLLPFINGLMLGFGELFAHEVAFRLGWGGTKVRESCPVDVQLLCGQRLGCYGILSQLQFVSGSAWQIYFEDAKANAPNTGVSHRPGSTLCRTWNRDSR